MKSTLLAGLFVLTASATPAQSPALPAGDPNKTALAVEALGRLKGVDINANPALKAAVLKVLEATRGTPNFVRIVQDFSLHDQAPGLLEVAVKLPAEESGVAAMRLLLAPPHSPLLANALTGTNSVTALKTAEALGNTGDKRILPLLQPLVLDANRDLGLRKQAVRALAQVQEGAASLLQSAREDKLTPDLKLIASMELNQVRWPALKSEAARLLPLPKGRDAEALPPVAALLKMPGDPTRGSAVFRRPEVGCIQCHRVHQEGVDFGPALTEIGTKLGKDAIYDALLDPSAGISFGFEAWQIEFQSGDEAYGLIVSETGDEIAMKDAKAILTRYKKSDIKSRGQSKLSIMPAGLQLTMSTQDLVDLVEYLSSLKKK